MIARRPWGRTGREVPVIGQGTWSMEADRGAAIAALRRGLDLGLSHVDTAESYGDGAVEELVGEALAGRRDQAFLVSKVLPQHASRQGTLRACEASLRRLGTDHLDGFLLHWEGPHPLEDTVAAFEELARDGKILSWGVSNLDERLLSEVARIGGPVACDQVLYHLEERAVEHAVLPLCERLGVTLVAYSPFGSGDFPRPGTAGRRVLDAIGAAHGATAHQVALAFLTRHPSVVAIPKAASARHVEENARIPALSQAEIGRIDAAFPLGERREGLPTL